MLLFSLPLCTRLHGRPVIRFVLESVPDGTIDSELEFATELDNVHTQLGWQSYLVSCVIILPWRSHSKIVEFQ